MAALALGAVMLFLACRGEGTAPSPAASPTGSPTPMIRTEVTREREGVRLTLSVDRETYGPGEMVAAAATVENTNDKSVKYTVRYLGDPAVSLWVLSEINGEQLLRGPDDPQVSQPVITVETMDPGGRFVRRVTWDRVLDTYVTPVQAPPGQYSIKAEFLVGEYAEGQEPASLTAAVVFKVEGSEPIITQQEAIQTAVLMPEVQEWISARGASVVCALAKRGLFYNIRVETGEPFETFDFIYQSQLGNGLPICSPVTEDGTWRVIFSVKESAPPTRISAFVDIHDGTPLRVEEGGPQPTPTSPTELPPTPASSG